MPSGANAKSKREGTARTSRRAKLAREFYASVLDAAERIELEAASEVEGLDEEIALLRVKLRKALGKRPDDLALMLRGIELPLQAAQARVDDSAEGARR